MDKLLSMGVQICQAAMKSTNTPVAAGDNYTRGPPDPENIKMLICALDYKKTQNPLTCTMDGKNMQNMARACGVSDITIMNDEECTSENVEAKIREIGERCGEDDCFIFYYSGHGTSKPDSSGDEEDGQDECFCFVDEAGQISYETCMDDDQFASIVTEAMPDGMRVLILTDCCHSGTIADLENPAWKGLEVVSIAGCLDSQTSGDMGKGGIFTHSMLMAVERLQQEHDDEYSVGLLYNATLNFDEEIFHSAQDITIQTNSDTAPDRFAWPLLPQSEYQSPMSQAAAAVKNATGPAGPQGPGGAGGENNMMQALMSNPQLMQQLGIKPSVAQMASQLGALQGGKLDVNALMGAAAQSGKCNVM